MSGGGTKLLKGRMGSRIVADVSPAQLEAMEKSLENETKAAAVLLPDYYTLILDPLFFFFFFWLVMPFFELETSSLALLKLASLTFKKL